MPRRVTSTRSFVLQRLWDLVTFAIVGAGLYQLLWWMGAIAGVSQ